MPDLGTDNKRQVNMVSILLLLVSILAVSIPVSRAVADDSIARFGAGGITFLKSEDIRMLEEVLEISTEEVRVKFRFLNESGKDIHATVAFPLPPYSPSLVNGPSNVSNPSFVMATFKVWIEGQPVQTNFQRRVVTYDNRDITPQLRDLDLSDEQIFEGADLTDDQRAALEKLYEGKREFLNWEVAATAFWERNFPAGKEIIIEHTYKPAIGQAYDVRYRELGYAVGDNDEACLDERTKRALENKHMAFAADNGNPEDILEFFQDVEYILGTGRNWKGPIGQFTLRIVKETPDTIVSLCFPGKPKKISPTVYEFYQQNFVPPDKVVVYTSTGRPLGRDPYDFKRSENSVRIPGTPYLIAPVFPLWPRAFSSSTRLGISSKWLMNSSVSSGRWSAAIDCP